MDKQSILRLDGYLLALRRLSGNKCDFWADIFNCEGDIEQCFADYLAGRGGSLVGKSVIGYREINTVLENEVFSKLQFQDESLLKLFSWDIVEYLQMSFRDIEAVGDPISSKRTLLFDAKSEFHGDYVYVVIQIGTQAVALGLATRT